MKHLKDFIAWLIRMVMIIPILLMALMICLFIIVVDVINWAWNRE